MKKRKSVLALTAALLLLPALRSFAQEEAPEQLMKDVAYNEVQDRGRQSCWIYHVERKAEGHTLSELQIESTDGPVYRLLAVDGQPLTAEQSRAEDNRLASLLAHPEQQRKIAQAHEQDEERLQRLTALLPTAFTYTEVSHDAKSIRLLFAPNPDFHPPTYEARAFASLSGSIEIDAAQKRLMHLDGSLIHPVDFGFGLIGRIEQGGSFSIARTPVSDTHWKTSRVAVHVNGRIILFKSISKQQDEMRSDFHPLPDHTTLKDAVRLLDEKEANPAAMHSTP
ncbi:hypothetical protein [Silvibacterium dinghuense]|uniref:Uncharacterized protein n=1 Tax=Silvibacterium dinghuense TaxID=1560006 RepID=A0A4Q1SHZ4_9BACT|nr:hypothetical protein [Silvibacterium dinghuense]RXS97196.1 hypothetical protein ESZ00_04580 [Silvibacterium dinghuense]GGG97003.1 hypothetical protein GCM10011586_10300 [Silvibacterium dinghuense]